MNKQKLSSPEKKRQKVSIKTARQSKQKTKTTPIKNHSKNELPLVFAKSELKKTRQNIVKTEPKIIKQRVKIRTTRVVEAAPQKNLPLIYARHDLVYCLKCGAEHAKNAEYCSLCYEKFVLQSPKKLTTQEMIRSQILEARAIMKSQMI